MASTSTVRDEVHALIDEIVTDEEVLALREFLERLRRAEHPVYENFRVQTFRQLLQNATEDSLRILGELMYQSHASYSRCGLGSDGTDRLVEIVRAYGHESGLFGAKITGGGSGGTVAILGKNSSAELIEEIADNYFQETGHEKKIFKGSSPGANTFGSLVLSPV